jgi:outer membrane receptor protein involved in Fe transport
VSPQLRIDRLGVTGETVASPRLSARYSLSERVSVNFATGVYYQVPDLFTFTISSDRALKAQRATHIVGGIEWLASPDVRIRAEVFRKDYSRLAVRPFGTTTLFGNTGEGSAEGMEFSLQKSLSGMFAGQISYSYVKSRRSLCDGCFAFPADVERPHQLILLGITRVWGFTIGGKYRLASGLPYSVRTPVTIAPGSYLHRLARVEDINARRLGKFSVLDMRVEKKFDFKRWSIAPFFDLFNVFAANEGTEVTYELNRRTPRIMNEGTRLPIIGLRMEF